MAQLQKSVRQEVLGMVVHASNPINQGVEAGKYLLIWIQPGLLYEFHVNKAR